MIFKNILEEWKIWRTVRRVVKENAKELENVGFYCDWVGRIYTVINIPEEFANMPVNSRKDYEIRIMAIDSYIKQQLMPVSEVLTKLMLADLIIYPDKYEMFENTNSVLIVLAPERKWSKPFAVFLYFTILGGMLTGAGFLINYLIHLIK